MSNALNRRKNCSLEYLSEQSIEELFQAAGIGCDYEATTDEEERDLEIFREVPDPNKEVVIQPVEEDVKDFSNKAPVKRRLHGKQYVPPVLRLLRTGGEWTYLLESHEIVDEEYKEMDWDEKEKAQMWDGLVQAGLRQAILEEKGYMDFSEVGKLVKTMEEEAQEIEARLARCMKADEEKVMEECSEAAKEVLTSRTVALDEVKRNLGEWIPSLSAEYQSLLSHGAIKPISQEEYQKLQERLEVTTVPGMVVSVIKPPYKLKSRFVACGNYVEMDPNEIPETAAGGLDAIVARVMVSVAARRKWRICTADVRTAFLQADRRPTPGRATVVTPPGLLKETNILQEGCQERWLIQKAIYGLIESPKDWADHRDAVLQRIKWIDEETKKEKWIERTDENHLWQVRTSGSLGT